MQVHQTCCRAAFGLLVASLLTSCAAVSEYMENGFKVGPTYSRPLVPVADDWIDGENAALEGSSSDLAEWWTVFEDETLNRLVQDAYDQSLTIRTAGLRVMEARAQRRIAAGSIFPQGQEAIGSLQHFQLSEQVSNQAYADKHFSQWNLGGGLFWELDFWGRFRRAIEAADANVDASIEDYDHALVLLIAEVAGTYIEYRTFEQQLVYARENIVTQEESVRVARLQREAGRENSEIDLPMSLSNLRRSEAIIPALQTALRVAQNRLCILLGEPPHLLQELLDATQSIPSPSPSVVLGVPADLVRRRPDVRRAERELAAQSAQIGIAVSDLLPQISVTGSIFVDANQFADMFGGRALSGAVGPDIHWNILNYGRIVNNIDVQDLRFEQLVNEYQQSTLKAAEEAENAVVQFLNSKNEVDRLALSAEEAGNARDVVLEKYTTGKIGFTAVFILESLVLEQQNALALAQGRQANSLVQVYKALGGGWELRLNRAELVTDQVPEVPIEPEEIDQP
ncbi:MAG: efflux transporter outer membrane subunit [Pirellulaceae bacterium]|nr:efflux transporter outer membrane subunit [Planctomycetaceae bacterium]